MILCLAVARRVRRKAGERGSEMPRIIWRLRHWDYDNELSLGVRLIRLRGEGFPPNEAMLKVLKEDIIPAFEKGIYEQEAQTNKTS